MKYFYIVLKCCGINNKKRKICDWCQSIRPLLLSRFISTSCLSKLPTQGITQRQIRKTFCYFRLYCHILVQTKIMKRFPFKKIQYFLSKYLYSYLVLKARCKFKEKDSVYKSVFAGWHISH